MSESIGIQEAQFGPWYHGLCNDNRDVDFSFLHPIFSEVEMENDELSARLARLERSNRRLRIWLIILTLGLIAGVFFKPFSVIKNPLGGEMIGATTYDGSAVQGFWNRSHIRRLEMGVVRREGGTPAVYLLGEDEKLRLGLDLRPQPTLTFCEPSGAARMRMHLTPDGTPNIGILDETEKVQVFLGILADKSPSLKLVNASGKGGVYIGTQADGTPVLQITDKNGKEIFRVPERESQP
jgi:hypothetical protein